MSGFAATRSDASVSLNARGLRGTAVARPLDAEAAAKGATDDEAAEADVQGGWFGPRWSGAVGAPDGPPLPLHSMVPSSSTGE
eukprot:2134558-Pyramimonas_sp.AAC.1